MPEDWVSSCFSSLPGLDHAHSHLHSMTLCDIAHGRARRIYSIQNDVLRLLQDGDKLQEPLGPLHAA